MMFSIMKQVVMSTFQIRLKPQVIQLPITGKCNSRCLTCNVWKNDKCSSIDAEKLADLLKNPYFRKVKSVGINGGEPSLYPNFTDVINSLLQLNRLKNIYIISNGMATDKLLGELIKSKQLCDLKNIKLSLTLSIDGVDEIHDQVRGIKGSFDKVITTYDKINENPSIYCSSLHTGVTISSNNSSYLASIMSYLADRKMNPIYHIAVPNKRIGTFNEYPYYILNDIEASWLTREFFYGLFKLSKDWKSKLIAFQNYYFILTRKRISLCNYLYRDITIDENLDLYLCATASDKIGSLREHAIQYYKKDMSCMAKNVENNCSSCAHYILLPSIKGLFLFVKEALKPFCWINYMIRSKLSIY